MIVIKSNKTTYKNIKQEKKNKNNNLSDKPPSHRSRIFSASKEEDLQGEIEGKLWQGEANVIFFVWVCVFVKPTCFLVRCFFYFFCSVLGIFPHMFACFFYPREDAHFTKMTSLTVCHTEKNHERRLS